MTLSYFRQMGRSGLIVSPLALGTMTFGREGWGTDEAASRAVFDAYADAGGNFVDTAEAYVGSEELLGRFVRERGDRDRWVIATKFGWGAAPGNPNAGGSGRLNVLRAVEGSLRRLGTDRIDLYWVHVWDRATPAPELLLTLNDLIRAGKVRYFGLSNVPAWFAVQIAMLARQHGLQGPIAGQHWYSLVERSIENEHLPAAREFGLAIQPWAPLATGLLTGKYDRNDPKGAGGRLSGPNLMGDALFTERNWAIVDELKAVAAEAGRTPVQVALAWVLGRPGVVAPVVGARSPAQLRETAAALDESLAPEHLARLEAVSAPPEVHPYFVNSDGIARAAFGADVARWT